MGLLWEQPFRPPTSVMLLCALMFVCSTVIMTIYVQHSHLVPNPEISKTWAKILKGLSGMELCASEKGPLKRHPDTPFEYVDMFPPQGLVQARLNAVSITVNADVRLVRELTRLPQGPVAISGELPIDGWGRLCYSAKGQQAFVNVSFILPENLTQSESREVCVILSGPVAVVPLSRPAAICIPPIINMNKTIMASLKGRSRHNVKEQLECDGGSVFEMKYNHQADYLIYPSPVEKGRIARNLQIVSGGILLMCFICVVSKLCCRKRFLIVNQDNTRLLFPERDHAYHTA